MMRFPGHHVARLSPLPILAAACLLIPTSSAAQVLFEDDFEDGLARWTFPHGDGHELVDTGDPERSRALALRTASRLVVALIDGSEHWGDVRIEGEVLFPEDVHNYLGFVYRLRENDGRTDFGSLYIKGNSSYVRVNPHYDWNVGRRLYEELRTPLRGPGAITVGAWQSFALEVVGGEAHLYVGDVDEPQVTFPFFEGERGAFGFKPRNPGGAVWIDRVLVREIDGFSYSGPPRPDTPYRPGDFVTGWRVLGPLTRFHEQIEGAPFDPDATVRDGGRTHRWEPFETDARGAVLTGKVTQYEGSRRVAYFLGTVTSDEERIVPISISSVDDLSVWWNGQFLGYLSGGENAWWDLVRNPEHERRWGTVRLRRGENHVLVRVVGGTYATGGFFLSLKESVGG